jgi:hypothetical protein
MAFKRTTRLGVNRMYDRGRSTVGYIKGDKVLVQSDVKPGDLMIGVDHKNQKEFMVEVIQNPNPLNISLIHFRPVYTTIGKRKGLQVKDVKNSEPSCVLTAELGLHEFWIARQRQVA